MSKDNVSSRNGRRQNTKAPTRKACQQMTKSVVRRAQRSAMRKAAKRRTPNFAEVKLALFNVRNTGTKREIQVRAEHADAAIARALSPEYRLARSAGKLTANPV